MHLSLMHRGRKSEPSVAAAAPLSSRSSPLSVRVRWKTAWRGGEQGVASEGSKWKDREKRVARRSIDVTSYVDSPGIPTTSDHDENLRHVASAFTRGYPRRSELYRNQCNEVHIDTSSPRIRNRRGSVTRKYSPL